LRAVTEALEGSSLFQHQGASILQLVRRRLVDALAMASQPVGPHKRASSSTALHYGFGELIATLLRHCTRLSKS
jgi:hypothetical protein